MQRSSGCGNGKREGRSDETDAVEEENVEERPPNGEPRKRNTHMNEVVVRVVGNGTDVCVGGGRRGEGGSVGRLSDGCVCARVGKVVEERAQRGREEGGDETKDE
jgi:hypothetical protein